MSLIDRLKTLESAEPLNTCPMARVFSELDEETATLLKKILESKTSTKLIHQELHKEGVKIARDSISIHRKGQCRCSVVAA